MSVDPAHDLLHGAPPDADTLAHALAPALRDSCRGCLGDIRWFRAAWQRGGAATGLAEWTESGRVTPVLIKMPLGPAEHRWTQALSRAGDRALPTPRVLASGTTLGHIDLCWVVMERLPGGPLSQRLTAQGLEDMLAAAADFYHAAARVRPIDLPPPHHDWPRLIHRAREAVRQSGLPDVHRWRDALRRLEHVLPDTLARWNARRVCVWCHGDLHPGNALHRPATPDFDARCVLIDLALVHAGHWVEDAVYLERLYWGKPEMLHGVKPVTVLGRLIRDRDHAAGIAHGQGLADDDYGALADIRRALAAGVVPLDLDNDGHQKYTHAALDVLEKVLPRLPH